MFNLTAATRVTGRVLFLAGAVTSLATILSVVPARSVFGQIGCTPLTGVCRTQETCIVQQTLRCKGCFGAGTVWYHCAIYLTNELRCMSDPGEPGVTCRNQNQCNCGAEVTCIGSASQCYANLNCVPTGFDCSYDKGIVNKYCENGCQP